MKSKQEDLVAGSVQLAERASEAQVLHSALWGAHAPTCLPSCNFFWGTQYCLGAWGIMEMWLFKVKY